MDISDEISHANSTGYVRVEQMRMLPLVGLSMVPMMFSSDVLPPIPDKLCHVSLISLSNFLQIRFYFKFILKEMF